MWNPKPKKINQKFVAGTPIVVIDLKTSKSLEFSSISETARHFNTYPKTIWRVVYGNKLYHSKYKIMVNDTKVKAFKKYKYIGYSAINNNLYLFSIMLILLVFIIILCILAYRVIIIYKEVYSDYIYNVHSIRINSNRQLLGYKFDKNSDLLYSNLLNINNSKISKFIEIDNSWKTKVKLGFYYKIINEVNLDFSSVVNSSIMNPIQPINSSPIIERIDLNTVFSKMVINTAPIIESMDSNSLSINSNRNSLTLNTSIDLLRSQNRNKELLNYQSNILYLLINNLSPSIY